VRDVALRVTVPAVPVVAEDTATVVYVPVVIESDVQEHVISSLFKVTVVVTEHPVTIIAVGITNSAPVVESDMT
jgi:hypothetical protein